MNKLKKVASHRVSAIIAKLTAALGCERAELLRVRPSGGMSGVQPVLLGAGAKVPNF